MTVIRRTDPTVHSVHVTAKDDLAVISVPEVSLDIVMDRAAFLAAIAEEFAVSIAGQTLAGPVDIDQAAMIAVAEHPRWNTLQLMQQVRTRNRDWRVKDLYDAVLQARAASEPAPSVDPASVAAQAVDRMRADLARAIDARAAEAVRLGNAGRPGWLGRGMGLEEAATIVRTWLGPADEQRTSSAPEGTER